MADAPPLDSVVAAPERIATGRLVLRRPSDGDAEAIFRRYASDAEVTRYVAWPRHRSIDDTRAFLEFSETEWSRWPAGPYLAESRATGELLGGTGIAFETPQRASTGYVLARDAWGRGLATEMLAAMMVVADQLAIRRVQALVHHEHGPSARVLEKCGFALEGRLRRHTDFPNLPGAEPSDVLCYARLLG